MDTKPEGIDLASSFDEVAAEDRRRLVVEHVRPSLITFFLLSAYVGVMEWITRPVHRSAVVIVAVLYVLIMSSCLALLRWRPQWAVGVAIAGVSAVCAAMLSYSPMVHGSGELCVLSMTILLGGFTVTFPLGLRNQLLASIVPVVGYATVLQLGTTTGYPVWYSASALVTFLFVLAIGARAMERYRERILEDAFHKAALAAANARLRDEACAADRAKSDLMSILSHELRTPLSAIRFLSEALAERLPSNGDELNAALQRLRRQSKLANDMVTTLLEFDSIETGALRLSVEELDVADLLDRVRAEIAPALQQPNVQVHWELPSQPLVVRTDRGKLEAIVRNLVYNALRHTPSGSVSVTASEDPASGSLRLIVADTGEGISQEALPHIFERFSRATSSGDGFGLGLYIVRRFAAALGGEVHVESTPGAGSRFEVVVPKEALALAPTA